MHDLCNLSYYHVCSVTEDDYFSDFPVNIWVASFLVYAFRGSKIIQSGVYMLFQPITVHLRSPVL